MADPRADPRPRPKGLDAALEAAFKAGAHFGAGYPAYEAIPADAEADEFQYWRRRWNDSHGTIPVGA